MAYRFIKLLKKFIVIIGLCIFVYTIHSLVSSRSMSQCDHNISRHSLFGIFWGGSKKKVVSFSLYASVARTEHVIQRYRRGIKENLEKIRKFYPGWSMRIYTNISVTDQRFFKDVRFGKDLSICDINTLPNLGNLSGLKNGQVWRFLPMFDPTVDIFISRDMDSVVNARERAAVKQWEESDKVFHAMRDNPMHYYAPVMAGMWGAKNYLFDANIATQIYKFSKAMKSTTNDQVAIDVGLFTPLKSLFMVHDSYLCESMGPTVPFPNKREDPKQFVGKVLYGKPFRPGIVAVCPVACRPDYGKDWIYC